MFLDRDGVLNELADRDGRPVSPRRVEDFRLFDDARGAVAALRQLKLLLFVVTNQPDIARGKMTRVELDQMMGLVQTELQLDDIRICAHDEIDHCDCRKPQPGMLLDLGRRWNIDLHASFVIGDSWRDVEAGRRAGCVTIFLDRRGRETSKADVNVNSLRDAAAYIVSQVAGRQ